MKLGTVILHSRADETVPFADSEELVRNGRLPLESLIEVGTEHRLADPESLDAMVRACEESVGSDPTQEPKQTFPSGNPLGKQFTGLSEHLSRSELVAQLKLLEGWIAIVAVGQLEMHAAYG